MQPRKEIDIPEQVNLFQLLVTRLGDYTALEEDDDIHANIAAFAGFMNSEDDKVGIEEFGEQIADVFIQCLTQLSVQCPIIATLLSIVNSSKSNSERGQSFCTSLINTKLRDTLLFALREDDVPTLKLILKTVACLSSCGSFAVEGPGGLIELLESILQTGFAVHSTGHADPSAAQQSIYLVASTITWALGVLNKSDAGRAFVASVQEKITSYLSAWQCPFSVGGYQAMFLQQFEAEEDMEDTTNSFITIGCIPGSRPGTGYDSLMQACSLALALITSADGGQPALPSCMVQPWIALSEDLADSTGEGAGAVEGEKPSSPAPAPRQGTLSFGADFATYMSEIASGQLMGMRARTGNAPPDVPLVKHAAMAPAISSLPMLPPEGLGFATSNWLRARFAVFDTYCDSEDVAACCTLSPLEKHCAAEYFTDILLYFDPVVNNDGTKLGSIELLMAHLVAVFKLFPSDCHLEYLLVELLLQLMLQVPVSPARNSGIYKLLLTLCRKNPLFPPAVALGINTIYQMIPELEPACIREFGRWFSFHLLNTQLSWPYWDFWVDGYTKSLTGEEEEGEGGGEAADMAVTEVRDTSHTAVFCHLVVDKVARAAMKNRAETAFPTTFQPFISTNLISAAYCPHLPAPSDDMTEERAGAVVAVGEVRSVELAEKALRMIQSKADPDDLEIVLASAMEGDGVSEASMMPEEVVAGLLIEALLAGASRSGVPELTTIELMLDQYTEVIRYIAESEAAQMAILVTIHTAYSGDLGIAALIVEEVVRKGVVSVAVAARWLMDTSGLLDVLDKEPSIYGMIESVIDRTLDFAKARLMQRSQLGADVGALDMGMDLEPGSTALVRAPVAPVATMGGDEEPPTEEIAVVSGKSKRSKEDDDDDDEENGGRRTRQRRDEDDGEGEDVGGKESAGNAEDDEPEDDPVLLAGEAVKIAVKDSRAVFDLLLTSLVEKATSATAAGNKETYVDLVSSLLHKTMRVFLGTERGLQSILGQQVVLTDAPSTIVEKLVGTPAILSTWQGHLGG